MYDPSSPSYGSGSSPQDFTRLSQAVGNNIQKINNSVSQMQSLLSGSDGRHDASSRSTDKLLQIQHYTNQLAKETNQMVKDLNQLSPASSPSEQKQQRIQRDRLVNEFTKALNNFQAVQRLEKEREKANMVKAKASSKFDPFSESRLGFNDDREAVSFKQPQQQSVVQIDAADVDMEMMAEREEALHKLERDIVDVNQIFKDLGMLVHEQGEVIDSIEANVESASVNVEQGTEQLRQAKDYQSKSRKKKCIIITILIVILALIIIIPTAIYAPKS